MKGGTGQSLLLGIWCCATLMARSAGADPQRARLGLTDLFEQADDDHVRLRDISHHLALQPRGD